MVLLVVLLQQALAVIVAIDEGFLLLGGRQGLHEGKALILLLLHDDSPLVLA